MSRKLDNADCEQYINKFDSYKWTVPVKDFVSKIISLKVNFIIIKRDLKKDNSTTTTFHSCIYNWEN